VVRCSAVASETTHGPCHQSIRNVEISINLGNTPKFGPFQPVSKARLPAIAQSSGEILAVQHDEIEKMRGIQLLK
jgi:hypothetical protein